MTSNRLGTGEYVPKGTSFGLLTTMDDCRSVGIRVPCICQCGGKFVALMSSLKAGNTKSCGCLNIGRHPRHGLARRGKEHPVWKAWASMLQRCRDPNADSYDRYGGRGIVVCQEWQVFEGFRDDMLPTWAVGLSLERERVNGSYEKGNCKWISINQQARNRRSTRWVVVNGVTMSLAEAVERYAVMSEKTTLARIYELGWSVQDALTTPRRRP